MNNRDIKKFKKLIQTCCFVARNEGCLELKEWSYIDKIIEEFIDFYKNKTTIYKCAIEELKKILVCARNEDCDNCPKCEYCEELCDNKDNFIDVLSTVVNRFYEDKNNEN